MYRYVIEDENHVPPFNQPASELTIGQRPLKLHQEILLNEYMGRRFGQPPQLRGVFKDIRDLTEVDGESVVYRDNLWFDEEFLEYFMDEAFKEAKATGRASRASFSETDDAFRTYTLPLAHDLESSVDAQTGETIYLLDLWYFPKGFTRDVKSLVVPSDAHEIGFFAVPDYMTMEQGDLTHYAPMRAVVSIESWVHVYFASIIFGTFARAGRLDKQIERSFFTSLKLLWRAVLEQKQILSASGAVQIGSGCDIDPSVIIKGPTKIGDRVTIGAGAIIDNCTIGNDVSIDAGCMLFQSTVADSCFLPFRAALYLTAMMENSIVAQNTCLQMCVIGRNTFIGAGNTFTDFNMIGNIPIKVANRYGQLETVGQGVLGGAVGHNCRIGSGMVIMPGRMIESDVVLIASAQRRVINRSVTYEESDHLLHGRDLHTRMFPRLGERISEDDTTSWDETW
jgi:UDP-N-acetylglucosamine diphosphorylase / glucose-1-phosphate thymidylyltransferase / UDP-N-acetylgalactosamine diphosphorylase / glucosamine-1-phosphate N-acetyltransferase / galactosamine-1-phosphate N-acetyltransferase